MSIFCQEAIGSVLRLQQTATACCLTQSLRKQKYLSLLKWSLTTFSWPKCRSASAEASRSMKCLLPSQKKISGDCRRVHSNSAPTIPAQCPWNCVPSAYGTWTERLHHLSLTASAALIARLRHWSC